MPGDLFAAQPITLGPAHRLSAMSPGAGPTDGMLRALADAGLSLRQIAEKAELSHETFRRRLVVPREQTRA